MRKEEQCNEQAITHSFPSPGEPFRASALPPAIVPPQTSLASELQPPDQTDFPRCSFCGAGHAICHSTTLPCVPFSPAFRPTTATEDVWESRPAPNHDGVWSLASRLFLSVPTEPIPRRQSGHSSRRTHGDGGEQASPPIACKPHRNRTPCVRAPTGSERRLATRGRRVPRSSPDRRRLRSHPSIRKPPRPRETAASCGLVRGPTDSLRANEASPLRP